MKVTRDPFALAAVFLAAVAFAGSFDHTHATVVERGQTGWVAVATALMPEVSVALSVLRIRKGGRQAQLRWAWLVLVSSAAFTVWANLEQAQPTVGGYVVGGWPAWAAIGAAGFIEMSAPSAPRVPRQRPVAPTVKPETTAPEKAPQNALSVVREPVSDVESLIVSYLAEHQRHPRKDEFAGLGVSRSRWFAHHSKLKERGLVA